VIFDGVEQPGTISLAVSAAYDVSSRPIAESSFLIVRKCHKHVVLSAILAAAMNITHARQMN